MLTTELNAEQREAVHKGLAPDCSSAVPIWVNAGAGTGKTATLSARVAALLRDGIAPERLVLLTFSRRAAQEMMRRVGSLIQSGGVGTLPAHEGGSSRVFTLPWAGTFHSLAVTLLRRHAKRLGLSQQFSVLDRGDALDLIANLRLRLLPQRPKRRVAHAATCLSILSDCVNTGEHLSDVLKKRFPWCQADQDFFAALFDEYTHTKQAQALMDFDDLLQWSVFALTESADAHALAPTFDAIIVDESQDCNPLQWQMLRALAPQGRGVFLVGDAAQCIYGFRGARLSDLHDYINEMGAQELALTRNYRSSQAILDLANALLADAPEDFGVSLVAEPARRGQRPCLALVEDVASQADFVIEQVLEARESGVRLRDQAVLFRSAQHSDVLELALARADIPFVKHGGLKFIEAAHVRDVLSVLRWACNPANRLAAGRALQLLPGVGPALAQRILANYLARAKGSAMPDKPFSRLEVVFLADASQRALDEFLGLLHDLAGAGRALDQFDAMLAWYEPFLREHYDNPQTRLADLHMLRATLERTGGLRELLAELALEPPQAASDLGDRAHRDDDYLILSTVHSAKGQEWHSVHVLNVTDGNFPNEYATSSKTALAEERRLLYVAMTRAKHRLSLIEPRCHYVTEQATYGAKHVTGARSRFFTAPVLACMDVLCWPDAGTPARSGGLSAPLQPTLGGPVSCDAQDHGEQGRNSLSLTTNSSARRFANGLSMRWRRDD